MDGLKPCPFCGGAAEVRIVRVGGSGTPSRTGIVRCEDCGARVEQRLARLTPEIEAMPDFHTVTANDMAMLLPLWNRRTGN